MYSTWTALFNNASLQFAPLLLASLYGAAIAGMFALTLRVLSIPASLVGGAVGNVFYSRAPQAHQEGNLHTLVETIHGKLATVAIPVLVVLLNFGPELFRFVFGEQWYKAGQYAQWMAPWLYFQFQWSPLSTIAPVLGLQREALISQTLTFIARIISLLCCAWLGTTADAAVLTFAVVSAIVYLLRQLWFLQRAGVATLKVMKRDALSILFLSLLVLPAHLALEVDSPSAQYFSIIYIVLLSLFWLRSLR
jgi:O-antigen/teichoic acid export membrane protein